jgi:hypothetical protein
MIKVGDLIIVNRRCDAGGLWDARGIVTEVMHKSPGRFDDRHLVRVLIAPSPRRTFPTRLALLNADHVDLMINEDR